MDADPFLDYLNEHETTAPLAVSLLEVLALRRASAERRARAGIRTIPGTVASAQPERVAS